MHLSAEAPRHTEFKHTERPLIKAGKGCECGIDEPHEHCGICGMLMSRGAGGTIAEYRLTRKGLRRT